MVFGEIIRNGAFHVEHANDFSLVHHGNRQLRARLGIDHDVARIHGDIRNQDRLFQRGCRAYDTFARRCAQTALHALAVFHIHAVPENLLLFVIQHDAQNLIIDHALGLFRGAPEQFFYVQNRAGLAAHFAQQEQGVRLRFHLFE